MKNEPINLDIKGSQLELCRITIHNRTRQDKREKTQKNFLAGKTEETGVVRQGPNSSAKQ